MHVLVCSCASVCTHCIFWQTLLSHNIMVFVFISLAELPNVASRRKQKLPFQKLATYKTWNPIHTWPKYLNMPFWKIDVMRSLCWQPLLILFLYYWKSSKGILIFETYTITMFWDELLFILYQKTVCSNTTRYRKPFSMFLWLLCSCLLCLGSSMVVSKYPMPCLWTRGQDFCQTGSNTRQGK